MSDVKRYYANTLSGEQHVVLASDYDALAASVDYHKDMAAKWKAEAQADLARIAQLEAALRLVRPFVDESLGQSVDAALAPKHSIAGMVDNYGDQAGEYFREKGGCDETLAKARALLPALDRSGEHG